jgi:hypothetical protein
MKRRSKLFKKKLLIKIGMLAVAAGLVLALFSSMRYSVRVGSENASAQKTLSANRKSVFVAADDIDAGDTLTNGVNVVQQQIYTSMDSSIYITSDDMGSTALVPITAGMAVTKNMVGSAEIGDDSREYEISVVNLMTTQNEYDYVDVRILFPDGTDYTVLSKKQIQKLSLENSIFYAELNEEEILRLSSATIDAYLTQGTRLYTTRYLEPTVQEASVPNYPLRTNVIDLVHNDPNVLTTAQETLNASARYDLETRIGLMSDSNSSAIPSSQSTQELAEDLFRSSSRLSAALSDEENEEVVEVKEPETKSSSKETSASKETNASKGTSVTRETSAARETAAETTAAARESTAETTAAARETTAAARETAAETTAAETTAAETTAAETTAAQPTQPVIQPVSQQQAQSGGPGVQQNSPSQSGSQTQASGVIEIH